MSNLGQSSSRRWVEGIVIGLIVTVAGGLILGGIHSKFGVPVAKEAAIGKASVSGDTRDEEFEQSEQGTDPDARLVPAREEARDDNPSGTGDSKPFEETDGFPSWGTYRGVAVQESKNSKTWDLEISFSPRGGEIEYRLYNPSRECGGALIETPDGLWLESISYGTCDNGGTWWFSQPSPDSLFGEYQPPVGSYKVTAELSKTSG